MDSWANDNLSFIVKIIIASGSKHNNMCANNEQVSHQPNSIVQNVRSEPLVEQLQACRSRYLAPRINPSNPPDILLHVCHNFNKPSFEKPCAATPVMPYPWIAA